MTLTPSTVDPATSTAQSPRASLILLLVLNLLTYMDRQVLAGVESLIQKDLLPDDPNGQAKMGFLATAFLLSYMAFSPAFGILGDKRSRWLLVALGTIVGSIATGATGIASSFLGVLTARIFVGISEAAYAPVAPTLLADLYPVERRGRVLAWFYAAIPVGSALGYVFGGLVSDAMSWHWAFILLVPPGIAAGVVALFFKDPRRTTTPTDPAPSDPSTPTPSRWKTYVELFRIRSYAWNVAGMTAMTFALGGIAFWMPRYIFETRGGGSSLGAVNFAFGAIAASAGLAATLTGGWLGDRLRGRLPGSYFLVSAAGMVLGFPAFLAVLFVPFPYAWFFLALAVFCLFLNTGPSNTALANVTPPPTRATAFALSIFVLHALGDAISPPLLGAIADRAGQQIAMGLVALPILLAAVFWVMASKHLAADAARIDAAYPDSRSAAVPLPT